MNEYEYWKNYRKNLIKLLKEDKKNIVYNTKEERNLAIYNMAIKSGIKATARYFNIEPKTVRYWVKKFENEKD